TEKVHRSEMLDLHTLLTGAPRRAPRQFLAEVIEARCTEILESARDMVLAAGFDDSYSAGVVLTGGTALVDGLQTLAESIFECEARLGEPSELQGRTSCPSSPIYSTAQGLLLYGLTREENPTAPGRHEGFMGRF